VLFRSPQSRPAAVAVPTTTETPPVTHSYNGDSAQPQAGKAQQSPASRGLATDAAAQATPTTVNRVQNAPVASPAVGQADAAAAAPPPAKEPVKTEERQVAAVEQQKRENERTVTVKADEAPKKSADFMVTDDRKESQARGRAEKNKALGGASAPVAGVAKVRRDGADEDKEADKDAAETRSVAGHHFRKQRGIWVDTAYDSREAMVVARGSESFRTLIADEPSLKTIADQLDGEIIVLWKGRAYRIR